MNSRRTKPFWRTIYFYADIFRQLKRTLFGLHNGFPTHFKRDSLIVSIESFETTTLHMALVTESSFNNNYLIILLRSNK